MNVNGRGAPGRHWRHDARLIPVTIYATPSIVQDLNKRAKSAGGSRSEEAFDLLLQGRGTPTTEKQLHEARVENRELKRVARQEHERNQDAELLVDELLDLLRRNGVHLDRDGRRRLLQDARRRREAEANRLQAAMRRRRSRHDATPRPSAVEDNAAA